jgi:pimeloyl-ACP methyl ester carboxylesterase
MVFLHVPLKAMPVHRQLILNDIEIHLAEAGDPAAPPILFLHGYPENWLAFEALMSRLKGKYRVLAIDLPGIGLSRGTFPAEKKALAGLINQGLRELQIEKITLAGHDAGGMVTYALLRHFPQRLSSAIIIGTALPGVAPWEAVKRNPYIWHFALYSVPRLPELLTTGRIAPLFDYFFDTLCHNKAAIPGSRRRQYVEAYDRPESLTTGYNWYRSFPQDEKDNAQLPPVSIPLLYVRGEKDSGKMEEYVEGLKLGGVLNLTAKQISGSGHFVPEENPDELAEAIDQFVSRLQSKQHP